MSQWFSGNEKNIDFTIHNISVDNGGEFKSVFEKHCKAKK